MKLRLLALLILGAPLLSHAQVDLNASLYGQFPGATNSDGITQSPSSSAGVMLGIRKYDHPWRGYEVTYSFNHANQDYSGTTLSSVAADAHSVTADYVVSFPFPAIGLRPFALGGGGLVFFAPQGSAPGTTEVSGVFSYGAGVDLRLVPHLGLRVQYRGLVYRAPDFGEAFLSTDSFTHTAQPMAGLYLQF